MVFPDSSASVQLVFTWLAGADVFVSFQSSGTAGFTASHMFSGGFPESLDEPPDGLSSPHPATRAARHTKGRIRVGRMTTFLP